MGFEQLAELRDRLRAEKQQAEPESAKPQKRKAPQKTRAPKTKAREQDPAVEAIWRLQKHFPLAFPVNPAPKVPLKEGILKDAEQHLALLGISLEQLKLGIAAWCRGGRYWSAMIENAPRLDLQGQPVGMVTAAQALHARQQARRQRMEARRAQAKAKAPAADEAAEAAAQPDEA
ncbi:ProP effector [Pseudomonas sp. THAF187a]|uniref:ProQ/FinO family protein n=1 Tax=unclassified Pseudomonas TaxID=196821 RepID=UPI001267C601|nr:MULTISPECIES: ProQ/FinO family protein [unclassified Pseudomonas]QFT21366.1 ProP effector [Pseudomonas sp. THAF187a]QFT41554.1 ProP effector [Pseudomonas sp. THAF42]